MTITDTRQTIRDTTPTIGPSVGASHRASQATSGTQTRPAGAAQASPDPTAASTPTESSGRETKPPQHNHATSDAQRQRVVSGVQTTTPTNKPTTPMQRPSVWVDPSDGQPASLWTEPKVRSLADPFLALAADVLDDAERTLLANQNRLRSFTLGTSPDKGGVDDDGQVRGFGLDASHPDVARLAALVDLLGDVRHKAQLNLARMLRNHPLGPWVKQQKGVGDGQAARLLAVIGDPYLMPDGTPRTVSQLWAYCGHGDPARRKFKGMTQADLFTLGNPTAKMRVWLIATSCLKAQGRYADVYYARKDATVGRTHARDCVRCGPSGHPALTGSPWSDAHRHADALRIVGKEILRGLWLEARRLHEDSP